MPVCLKHMYEALKNHVNNENLNHNGTTLQRIRKGRKKTKTKTKTKTKKTKTKTRR